MEKEYLLKFRTATKYKKSFPLTTKISDSVKKKNSTRYENGEQFFDAKDYHP